MNLKDLALESLRLDIAQAKAEHEQRLLERDEELSELRYGEDALGMYPAPKEYKLDCGCVWTRGEWTKECEEHG